MFYKKINALDVLYKDTRNACVVRKAECTQKVCLQENSAGYFVWGSC